MVKILNFLRCHNTDLLEYATSVVEQLNVTQSDKIKKLSNIRKIYKCGYCSLSDIKRKNLFALNKSLQQAGLKQSYINSIFSSLSVVCRQAVKEGYMLKNPILQLHLVKTKDIEPTRYLSAETFEEIKDGKMQNKTLQFTLDMYIFQLETGLAFADLEAATTDKIEIINGKKWLVGKRVKTHVNYYIPLSCTAMELIEKYESIKRVGNLTRKSELDLFPHISICYYNILLKKVAKELHISENLTSHRARHTFATLMLENGVSMEAISKMLGHSRPLMTQHYGRVTVNKIDKEVKKQDFFKFDKNN